MKPSERISEIYASKPYEENPHKALINIIEAITEYLDEQHEKRGE